MTSLVHLPAYATYLKTHHAEAILAEYLRWVARLDVPLLRPFRQMPAEVFNRLLRAAVDEYLTDLETGQTLARAEETIRLIESDRYPGIPRESIQPGDLVLTYSARKGALLAFLDRYPVDRATALAIVSELEVLFMEIQEVAIHAFTRIREETVKRMAEYEVRHAQLSDSLRSTEERLRVLIESAPLVILAYDRAGRITYAGGKGMEGLGARPEQFVGREAIALFGAEPHRERLERALAGEAFNAIGEFGGRSFETWFSPLRDRSGEVEGVVGVSLDVTDRRRMDTLKDQFLSILSHELRTPINAITGFGSILADGLAGPLSEVQDQYLRKMLAGADSLLALVDDLLDMSRIQAGEFRLAPAPMRFAEVVATTLETLTPLAAKKQHHLRASLPDDLPPMTADAQRVGQVITNLVGNAIKFTPPGGEIQVRAALEGDMLSCEVEDNGPGVAQADLPKLFERFTQLDMSATRKVGGVGLGLSICKALVEAHGGQIGVACEPGTGCTFWFRLPVAPVRVPA